MTAMFAYVTAPSLGEAEKIARAIVSERLAACANILPSMKSVYHWQGKVETASETVLILKTQEGLFSALEARVKALHSHDLPCVLGVPVTQGSAAYLD